MRPTSRASSRARCGVAVGAIGALVALAVPASGHDGPTSYDGEHVAGVATVDGADRAVDMIDDRRAVQPSQRGVGDAPGAGPGLNPPRWT
jgi:hypothetical protein